jgi:hypothetical protein
LSFSPLQWYVPNVTLPQREWDKLHQALDRLEISFASANGVVDGTTASGSKATAGNYGIGLRDMLLANPAADPRFDRSIQDEINDFASRHQPELLANPVQFDQDELQDVQDFIKKNNLSSEPMALTAGAAIDFTEPLTQYRWNGAEGWLTGNYYPIHTVPLQFIPNFTARGGQYEITKGVAGHQQAYDLGIQVKFVKTTAFDVYAQAAEQWKRLPTTGTGGSPVFNAGVEVKLPQWLGSILGSQWLQFGWSSKTLTSGNSFFGTSIRWQAASGASIK